MLGTVENHGTIAPGESPGTLTIQGDLVQAADGKLVIEIGGTTPGTLYDVLNITGKLTLGGTLEIDLLNGFIPGPNDVFNFLTFGSFDGSFANIISPQSLHLNFGPNGITAASAVPLPTAVWLLGSALGGLGFYRRRV
ncbi:MAG: VPLPA-CTERM sorting domain-containing protein [Gammaproteobacteria bacterium]|nr:VPLPA-CTERM sorting domain-containing protein [Gammaproteobacteria bacterium]